MGITPRSNLTTHRTDQPGVVIDKKIQDCSLRGREKFLIKAMNRIVGKPITEEKGVEEHMGKSLNSSWLDRKYWHPGS